MIKRIDLSADGRHHPNRPDPKMQANTPDILEAGQWHPNCERQKPGCAHSFSTDDASRDPCVTRGKIVENLT